MMGTVDENGRALLDVSVCGELNGAYMPVAAWIDTAFDGHLVCSRDLIETLNLESMVETEAILADGSRVTLETFIGYVDWFGDQLPLPVIANDGRFPLLGMGLLDQRVLHIDYTKKELHLD